MKRLFPKLMAVIVAMAMAIPSMPLGSVSAAPAAGEQPVVVTNNKSGSKVFDEPYEAENGIVSMSFKVTPETGSNLESGMGLRLYLGFYGKADDAAAAASNQNHPGDTLIPMLLEFQRVGDPFVPGAIRMHHSSGVGDALSLWAYGTTYVVTVEVNVANQQWRTIVNGNETGWRAFKNAVGQITSITAVSWQAWNNCGTAQAVLDFSPIVASVSGVTAEPAVLPKAGGQTTIIVSGENLLAKGTQLSVIDNEGSPLELAIISDTEAVAWFDCPVNEEKDEIAYTFDVVLNGENAGDVSVKQLAVDSIPVTKNVSELYAVHQVNGVISGNTVALRLEVMNAFAAMKPGDILRFFNDVAVATKDMNGALTIEVWPTAHMEEIRTALYALMPGDTLLFHEGTYGRIPAIHPNTGNNPTNSGTVDNPITIKGFPGEERPYFNNTDNGQNLWEVKMKYVDISHMKFSSVTPGLRLDGVEQIVKGITVSDCVFTGINGTNISSNAAGNKISDIVIDGNTFLNVNYAVMYFGTHGNYPAGAPTGTTGDNIVVTNNFIEGSDMDVAGDFTGYGIELKLDVVNSVIERNLFINTKGPGAMVYGADNADSLPNQVNSNLSVGSRTEAGVNIGGGPSVAYNNIALGNQTRGVYIQNYGARDINRNITITNNTSGLTVNSNSDYVADANNDSTSNVERNVVVEDNNFISANNADAYLKRQVDTIKDFTDRPANFDAFFDAITADVGPYTQEQLMAKLDILLAGVELAEPDYGKDVIKTSNNLSTIYKLPEPIMPNAGGIATLSFKYTAEAGADPEQGLRLFMGFLDSDTTLTYGSDANKGGSGDDFAYMPMLLEFGRSGGAPNRTLMYYDGNASVMAACGYGKTVDIKIELNVNNQTYRVTLGGTESNWRPVMADEDGNVKNIGAISLMQWNGTGTSHAVLGNIPWKAQAPKDYGTDSFTLGDGNQQIYQLTPNVTEVDGLLKYKVRVSPQSLREGEPGSYKLNVFLYEPGINPSHLGYLESCIPVGVNFVNNTQSNYNPAVKFLNDNGNESSMGYTWSLGDVYDLEFVINVAAQTYHIVVYDANGNSKTSDEKQFFNPSNPDYTTPVTAFGAVAFEQVSGISIIGNVFESLPEAPPDVVDKSILGTLIGNALLLEEEDYTPNSWSVFAVALSEAVSAYADDVITQDKVVLATQNLDTAMAALVSRANKTDLALMIASAIDLCDTNLFTAESVAALQTVIGTAQDVFEDLNADNDAVTAAVESLIAAINALEDLSTEPGEAVDKTALNGLAANVSKWLEQYRALVSEESFQALEEALASANVLLGGGMVTFGLFANDDVTQAQIDNAYAALLAAVEALEFEVSLPSDVETTLKEIISMSESDFEPAGWNVFISAASNFLNAVEKYVEESTPDNIIALAEKLGLVDFAIVNLIEAAKTTAYIESSIYGGDKKELYFEDSAQENNNVAFSVKTTAAENVGRLEFTISMNVPSGSVPTLVMSRSDLTYMVLDSYKLNNSEFITYVVEVYSLDNGAFDIENGEELFKVYVNFLESKMNYSVIALITGFVGAYRDGSYSYDLVAGVTADSLAISSISRVSLYDVNRDGKVTYADYDMVRRHLGLTSDSAEWTEIIARCDVDYKDGIIGNGAIEWEDVSAVYAAIK